MLSAGLAPTVATTLVTVAISILIPVFIAGASGHSNPCTMAVCL